MILDEPELHLGAEVLAPDLAGWRRERPPRLPETVGIGAPPDRVCEVLSPSTRRLDRGAKRDVHGEQGARFPWLVDPDVRLVEAFEHLSGRWTLLATAEGDAEARIPPFDAVALGL